MKRTDVNEMRLVCERLLEVLSPLRLATRDLGDVILALESSTERALFRDDWALLTRLTAEVAKEADDINTALNATV